MSTSLQEARELLTEISTSINKEAKMFGEGHVRDSIDLQFMANTAAFLVLVAGGNGLDVLSAIHAGVLDSRPQNQ